MKRGRNRSLFSYYMLDKSTLNKLASILHIETTFGGIENSTTLQIENITIGDINVRNFGNGCLLFNNADSEQITIISTKANRI